MNVLIVSNSSGGINHYTYCLADALQLQGIETSVLMSDRTAYDLQDLPHQHQVRRTLSWRMDRVGRLLNPLINLRALLQAARKADVVHYQWAIGPRNDPFQWSVLKRLGKRIVYTAHDVVPHDADERDLTHHRWMYENADAVIVHGQSLRDKMQEVSPVSVPRTRIVPHGNFQFITEHYHDWDRASARASFNFEPEDKVLLFFGMIRPYKGLETLIDACEILVREHPSMGKTIRLLIAGGTYQGYWEYADFPGRIKRAGLRSQTTAIVQYIAMEEVGRYFHAADIVTMPYKRGSQSGVLQFAYAFGKPLVVTNVGSIHEVALNDTTALCIPPDDPKAFADALARLIADPAMAARLGKAGNSYAATELSWDKIADQTAGIYREVLGSNA